MKILHTVESYYPTVSGMAEVVRQLSERLVEMGHEVTVATKKNAERKELLINGVQVKEFNIDGNAARGMTGEVDAYKNFLLNSSFDITTNFAAQQWATDITLPILTEIKGKKVNVPTGFSGLFGPEYSDYFESMKSWMKNYDANVFLSDNYRDINFAKENNITNNILIPNGAAADEFLPESKIDIRKKLGISNDAFLILHVGTYTGAKGHVEALKIYLKSEIKDGVFLFIGHHNDVFEKYADTGLRIRAWKIVNGVKNKKKIITSLSREETVAAYKAADLFLFPSNIECSPIVLFECMAAQLPFLTTDVGNTKEIIKWSNGGKLLPTIINDKGLSRAKINKSAKMLNEAYRNKQERKDMAEKGFAAWQKDFTWEAIALKYEKLYQQLLQVN